MSDILLLRSEPKKRKAPKRLSRFYWLAIIVLSGFVLVELVFQLLIAPNLRIEHVQVESDFPISDQELLAIAGIRGKEYYFSVRCDAVEANLASYPVVREVEVEKVFPDTLKIVLRQRKALALAFSYTEEKMVPVVFDAEGVIFQVGRSVSEWDLPVVSGLRFNPILGIELPSRLKPFLEEMEFLRENAPELFGLISEIKIYSTNDVDFELVLYPIGYDTRISLGEGIDEQSIKYALMVLDVMEEQGMQVEELDFRTGDVVYRLKEG